MKLKTSYFSFFLLLVFISSIFQTQIYASAELTCHKETIKKNRVSLETMKKIEKINDAESLFDLTINEVLTIEEVFELIRSFQNVDEIMENYTFSEIQAIAFYFIRMARIGVGSEDEERLEEQIEELLSAFDESQFFSLASPIDDDLYEIVIWDNQSEQNILLCSNKISKGVKKVTSFSKKVTKKTVNATKKACKETVKFVTSASKKTLAFVKDNGKETAIASALVIAGIVTYILCSNSIEQQIPPSITQDIKDNKSIASLDSSSLENLPNVIQSLKEDAVIRDVIEQKLDVYKEEMKESEIVETFNNYALDEPLLTLNDTIEIIKEMPAHLSHKLLDEVSDYYKIVSLLVDETLEAYDNIIPDNLSFSSLKEDPQKNFVDNFEERILEAHREIDQIFAVNQYEQYTKEAKEYNDNQFTQAILPPPTGILNNANALKKLSDAGKVPDRGGLTKAGRALAKHGGREGSIFPKPMGSPEQINQQGQKILENILNDPNKKIFDLGNGEIKIFASDGKGLHYDNKGLLKGFVEAQYEKKI